MFKINKKEYAEKGRLYHRSVGSEFYADDKAGHPPHGIEYHGAFGASAVAISSHSFSLEKISPESPRVFEAKGYVADGRFFWSEADALRYLEDGAEESCPKCSSPVYIRGAYCTDCE